MNAVWLRLLYIFEFLLAVPAIYTLWSHVGGQGHLDIMPWYWKLGLGMLGCLAIVRATAAAAEHEHAWNPRARIWIVGILLVGALMGAVTFYYHLHEAPDEVDAEESTTAVLFRERFDCQPA